MKKGRQVVYKSRLGKVTWKGIRERSTCLTSRRITHDVRMERGDVVGGGTKRTSKDVHVGPRVGSWQHPCRRPVGSVGRFGRSGLIYAADEGQPAEKDMRVGRVYRWIHVQVPIPEDCMIKICV